MTRKEKKQARKYYGKTRMWANAERDGRPAEYRVVPSVQRRKVWLTPNTGVRAVTLPRRESR